MTLAQQVHDLAALAEQVAQARARVDAAIARIASGDLSAEEEADRAFMVFDRVAEQFTRAKKAFIGSPPNGIRITERG